MQHPAHGGVISTKVGTGSRYQADGDGRLRRAIHLYSDRTELARDTPTWGEATRLIDSTPLPCGKSRETVKRSDLAGHAGYGYCASHSRFFEGFRFYLTCTPKEMPIIWGLTHSKIGEREAAEAMLRHDRHLLQPGQVIVGDKGFAGREFESFITDELGAQLIRPGRQDEKPRFGKLGGIRR